MSADVASSAMNRGRKRRQLRRIKAAAAILAVFGMCPAFAQHLSAPGNILYAPGPTLCVANFASNTIAKFDLNGTYLGSFPVSSQGPWRIALGPQQDFYVDAGADVIVYDFDGNRLRTLHKAFGNGLVVAPYDKLISVDANPAQVYSRSGHVLQSYQRDLQGLVFAGGSFAIDGPVLFYATGPNIGQSVVAEYDLNQFLQGTPQEKVSFNNKGAHNPTQIAVDARHNIYVVGYSRRLGGNSGVMVKMSRRGDILMKIRGLAFPYGVAVDPSGNIYISEQKANDVKVFNSSGALINAIE